MNDVWPSSYPQTKLPEGNQPQPYNPYQRRDDQIRLATRFGQGYDIYPAVAVLPLRIGDATIRCAAFNPMERTVCMNNSYFHVVVDAETERMTLAPACPQHVGALVIYAAALIENKQAMEEGEVEQP